MFGLHRWFACSKTRHLEKKYLSGNLQGALHFSSDVILDEGWKMWQMSAGCAQYLAASAIWLLMGWYIYPD